MYTSESLTNVFTYLIDLFGDTPNPTVLRGVVYDRACDLLPFLCRLSKENNENQRESKEIIEYQRKPMNIKGNH